MEDSGTFFVDKNVSWSSFHVVSKVRNLLRQHFGKKVKIGHAGTLDPLASGMLILCYGSKTKEISSYQNLEKEYTGCFVLGATTPSFDMETEVDRHFPTEHIDDELLQKTTEQFKGTILQRPPLFSAKWVEGERAYHLARKGEEHILPPHQVEIHEFEITERRGDEVFFRVRCGKGTYIRSLARDFGQALSSGAYLKGLRRTAIGPYRVDEAKTVDELARMLSIKKKEN